MAKQKSAKFKKVMEEWETGKLKSSSGQKITDQAQALAVALHSKSKKKGKK